MGNESCCQANDDKGENKVTSMEDMVAKRQLARAPVPAFTEKSVVDYKVSEHRDSAADGHLETRGETLLADGSKYTGQWRGEFKEGRGVLLYS